MPLGPPVSIFPPKPRWIPWFLWWRILENYSRKGPAMEQSEHDVQQIERDRDLPPDQPPYDWADPDLWDAPEEDNDA